MKKEYRVFSVVETQVDREAELANGRKVCAQVPTYVVQLVPLEEDGSGTVMLTSDDAPKFKEGETVTLRVGG